MKLKDRCTAKPTINYDALPPGTVYMAVDDKIYMKVCPKSNEAAYVVNPITGEYLYSSTYETTKNVKIVYPNATLVLED